MKKGIAVAGNITLDYIYPVNHYAQVGELVTIEANLTKTTGGAVCNVIVDLAKLDPALPLTALGVIGAASCAGAADGTRGPDAICNPDGTRCPDEAGKFIEATLSNYPNIDLSQIAHEGVTSFTAVISDLTSKQRTFFHYRGANARFSEKHIPWDRLQVDLLHIGYPLLLDELDQPDEEFGTKMARLLAAVQRKGIKTSIDLVSDPENRYKAIVPPALKYTDYCVINELEAERTTGIALRDNQGILAGNIDAALTALKAFGVSEWAIIHAPEGGYGLNCVTGEVIKQKSLPLPQDYIKGTTGAGDAFCAGVLYGAYLEKSLPEAIELGIACATCSLSEPGATEGMSSYYEVLKLYEKLKKT
ncbi:MAG TPA: carbohydrate kinase family protein [Bacillota bacterium]|nr:carbohydrate kinase family protein [Bacillota bacterium]